MFPTMCTSVRPLGFKFRPKDHELIAYLSIKANAKPIHCDDFMKEIDLYHIVDPGKLFTNIDSAEDVLYFFTKVKKVSKNGNNVSRKVSEIRFWRGVDRGQPVYDGFGCLIGQKRKFCFASSMKKMNLGYYMTEFVLDKKCLEEAKFKNYVVCKIRRDRKKVRESNGIHGEHDSGFQENSPATVLDLNTPFDSTALPASSTAARNSPIYNGEKDSAALSDPLPNCCSPYDGEQSLNKYNNPPELPEDVRETTIQDMFNAFIAERLSDPPQNICSQYDVEQALENKIRCMIKVLFEKDFVGLSDPPPKIFYEFL